MIISIHTIARDPRNRERPFRVRAARWLALAAMCVLTAPTLALSQTIDPGVLLDHVKYLASDELAGREAGEPGADSAAAYIAALFQSYGLEPLGSDGYRQPLEITTTITVAPDSRLILETSSGTRELELGTEWMPFNFSSAGSASGGAFPGGHGLSADAYEDIESPGIVVLLGGTPDDFDPHTAGVDPSPRRKVTTAREQGAEAVFIVVERLRLPQAGDPPHSVGIPAIQILESEEILALLDDEQLQIRLEAKVEPLKVTAYNLVGKLEGSDPARADEIVGRTMKVCDEVVSRFQESKELELREQVARALVNKGVALESLGRREETIAVYDEVVRRFKGEPALREQVDRAAELREAVEEDEDD